MNYIEIDGEKIELSKETTKRLKEELFPKKKGRFMPGIREEYYYISSIGNVSYSRNNGTLLNRYHIKYGNAYKTKEDAEFAKHKEELIKEVQIWADEHNDEIDWGNDKQRKFLWVYSYDWGSLYITYNNTIKYNGVHFSSKILAEKCWDIYGKDWEKYVWGIK